MDEYNKAIFADNLNRYMHRTNTKQIDICNLLGVSKSTVSTWCTGQKIPRMDKIELLANHFGILKSDLIEEKKPVQEDELDKKRSLIAKMYEQLDEAGQEKLIEYAEFLANKKK